MIYSLSKLMEIAEREKALGREVLFESIPDGSIEIVSTWTEDGVELFHHIECDDCREKELEDVPVFNNIVYIGKDRDDD